MPGHVRAALAVCIGGGGYDRGKYKGAVWGLWRGLVRAGAFVVIALLSTYCRVAEVGSSLMDYSQKELRYSFRG